MSCPWDEYTQGTIKFCEQSRCSWVTQPANTYSNIGYLIIGIYLISLIRKSSRPYYYMIALSAILTAVGSAFFHGSSVYIGELTDLAGMFLFSGFWFVHNLGRMLGFSEKKRVLLTLFMFAFAMIEMYYHHSSGILSFAFQITLAVVLELKELREHRAQRKVFRNFFILSALFALSFVFWNIDFHHIVCSPEHWLQGHALWHLTNAPCFYFLYKHFLSKEEVFDK